MEDETPRLIALPLVPIIDESIIPDKVPVPNDPLDQQFPIVEMFYSVQGEGYHTGIPSSFDEWENMTLRRIIREMAPWDCNRIVLTGGEPALQDLTTLSKILRPMGYELAIETNGTIEIPQDIIDWICVSPKDQLYSSVKIRQRMGDELKVVWVGQTLDMYDELVDGFTHHFLQPCYDENKDVGWNGKNFLSTFDMVRNNPGWNLSLQTHKWMGVD